MQYVSWFHAALLEVLRLWFEYLPELLRSLPPRIDRFIVSPDGKRIAIPGSAGEVAVLEIDTRAVQKLSNKNNAQFTKSEKYANRVLIRPSPAWRSADELSFIVPAGHPVGGPRRGELVLQQLNAAPRAISKSWSDEMTDSFLPRPK